jgi:hypothetical protein
MHHKTVKPVNSPCDLLGPSHEWCYLEGHMIGTRKSGPKWLGAIHRFPFYEE